MASTSDPAANKGKAPALYGDDDDDRHRDMVTKMMMMREERVSMGIPPGWRFCPTDEELIVFYLRNRTWNNSRIIHLDIYDFTPMQLAEYFEIPEDPVMFFYTTRKRKYKNGKRPSRTANIGYWKATGKDTPINEIDGSVGVKKSLVFYLGQQKEGKKTDWIMHEYTLQKEEFEACVLCKVYETSRGRNSRQNTRNEANTVSNDVGEQGTNPSTTRSQAEEDQALRFLPLPPPPRNIYCGSSSSSSSSNLAGQYDVHMTNHSDHALNNVSFPQCNWASNGSGAHPEVTTLAPMAHAQLENSIPLLHSMNIYDQDGYLLNENIEYYQSTAPYGFEAQSLPMYNNVSQPNNSGYGMAPTDTTEEEEELYLLHEPLPDFSFPIDDNAECVPFGMPVESAKLLNSVTPTDPVTQSTSPGGNSTTTPIDGH
ncbi:unnamed protein product [Prunus armeniaca]|uniref:NAC domain-containing protein n=1 Tax=Prunus armeniaca TaxID=36596 RepID=A0A6J5VES6_PRUAR|nr:unnamed protein product [Prunus armeniaca]